MSVEKETPTGVDLEVFSLDYVEEVPTETPEETPSGEEKPKEEEEETPGGGDPETPPAEETPEEEEEPAEEPKAEEEEEEETPSEPSAAPTDDEQRVTFTPFAQALFQINGWEWDDKLMPEDNLGSYNDLMKNIIEANVQQALKNNNPFVNEDVQRLNELVAKGADVKDAYAAMFSSPDYDNMDLNDEGNQETVVRRYLKETTRFSDERIEKEIKKYKDLDELEEQAKEGIDVLKQVDADKDKELEKQLEAQAELQKQEQAKLIQSKRAEILEAETIAGYKMDKKLANEFNDYLFKPDEKTGMTPYQAFVKETPDWDIQAAMIAFKKIGKDKVTKMEETKAAELLHKKIFGAKGEKKRENNSASQKPNRVMPTGDNPAKKDKVSFDDFVL